MRKRVDAVVVGLGAVGTAVAVALAKGGASVAAVTRSAGLCGEKRIEARGLGEATIPVCGWETAHTLNPSTVIVAVKAYDVPQVLETVRGQGWAPGLLVMMQNGLGPLEAAEQLYGAKAVGAVVYTAATRLSTGRVVVHSPGKILLGPRLPRLPPGAGHRLEALAETLRNGGLEARAEGWIEPWRWMKLAVNAAINPVTALAAAPNRVVVEDPEAETLARQLAREAATVAGLHRIPLPGDPEAEAVRVARATGDNLSSMLQDLLAGRPTEVDYINGAVAVKAREKGGVAPVNETVARAVKLLEQAARRGSWRPSGGYD